MNKKWAFTQAEEILAAHECDVTCRLCAVIDHHYWTWNELSQISFCCTWVSATSHAALPGRLCSMINDHYWNGLKLRWIKSELSRRNLVCTWVSATSHAAAADRLCLHTKNTKNKAAYFHRKRALEIVRCMSAVYGQSENLPTLYFALTQRDAVGYTTGGNLSDWLLAKVPLEDNWMCH